MEGKKKHTGGNERMNRIPIGMSHPPGSLRKYDQQFFVRPVVLTFVPSYQKV
jgi:hypothetical protein